MEIKAELIELTPEQIAEREEWEAGEHQRNIDRIMEQRRNSYIINADPLFFGWQRGNNTEQEWLDAVQAVKDANPYPAKPTA